jgi:hypothetical protein
LPAPAGFKQWSRCHFSLIRLGTLKNAQALSSTSSEQAILQKIALKTIARMPFVL